MAKRDLDGAEAAGLSPQNRKLLEFVESCVKYPWRVTSEQLDELRQAGFSDEQIAEAAMNVALFLGLTTMADVYGLQDSGFHLRETDPRISPEEDEVLPEDSRSWQESGTGEGVQFRTSSSDK